MKKGWTRTMKLGMRVWCSASSLLSLRPLERYRPLASVSDGPPGIRCVRGTTALSKGRHAAGQYDGKRGQVENVWVSSLTWRHRSAAGPVPHEKAH